MRQTARQTNSGTESARRGVRLAAEHVGRVVRGGRAVLDDVSFVVEPGEVVAVVGGSGAGKTTLLEVLAGVHPPTSGRVTVDNVDVGQNLTSFRQRLGYVPQDDIIHVELPLRRTLCYAARLRLSPTMGRAEVDAAVDDAMSALDLASRAEVRVAALSGGQRKRASIAVELITNPDVFFLDEPTSGLDPATGAQLMQTLRRLAASGATVVLTTHAVQDIAHCDRVVFLAPGGRLAYAGPPADALRHFGVSTMEEVYGRLGELPPPAPQRSESAMPEAHTPEAARGQRSTSPGALRQWAVLTARTSEALARNRLTMAILIGAPVMVVAMFAILFRPGAFDPQTLSPSAITMIIFWIAFGAFFFGLTYGLLQICVERPIVAREHLVGLRLMPYLLSKVTVLLPFLLFVDALMLLVLRVLDRLPAADAATYASVMITLALDAGAGLTLGLLASAAVANPSQATLALPMLCFPAVLFSGAILPVNVMAPVGAAISIVMPDRWAFEAIGHDLRLRQLLSEGSSPLGPPLLESFGPHAGAADTTTYWGYLVAFNVAFVVAAYFVLRRRVRTAAR